MLQRGVLLLTNKEKLCQINRKVIDLAILVSPLKEEKPRSRSILIFPVDHHGFFFAFALRRFLHYNRNQSHRHRRFVEKFQI